MSNGSYNNYQSYVRYGIDKIALGIETRHLNYKKSPEALRKIVDIVNWGNWSELIIQLEINGVSNIDFYNPWVSVLRGLEYCINNGFFKNPLALSNCIKGIYSGMLNPYTFLHQFMNTGIFKLVEYELFFDFYGYKPFKNFDESCYKRYKNSLYTQDHKVKRRPNGESKGERRSILSFYNRGLKIKSPLKIFRLEFRICDERAKIILSPVDIYYSVPVFIELHGEQIKRIAKHYLPEGSVDIDKEYIYEKGPILSKLLWFLDENRGCH